MSVILVGNSDASSLDLTDSPYRLSEWNEYRYVTKTDIHVQSDISLIFLEGFNGPNAINFSIGRYFEEYPDTDFKIRIFKNCSSFYIPYSNTIPEPEMNRTECFELNRNQQFELNDSGNDYTITFNQNGNYKIFIEYALKNSVLYRCPNFPLLGNLCGEYYFSFDNICSPGGIESQTYTDEKKVTKCDNVNRKQMILSLDSDLKI